MKRLIGLSGATASGKTTIARSLIAHFKADTHRFSEILATIATEIGLPTTKESLQILSTSLRSKLGEDVLARGMCEWVKTSEAPTVVVEGIRREADVELLSKTARETGRTWTLFYIDASADVRFKHLNKRLSEEGRESISRPAFDELDAQECEVELPLVKGRADLVLDNSISSSEKVSLQAIAYLNN